MKVQSEQVALKSERANRFLTVQNPLWHSNCLKFTQHL